MSIVESSRRLTPQDLLALPDGARFELVDGELVERPVSVLSSMVEIIVGSKLLDHCSKHGLGVVLSSSNGIQCFPDDPKKVRKPDASFVRKERFGPQHMAEGFLSIPPDLAVEVISPGDLASEIDEKIEEYLEAGVALVWVIDPETRIVLIHRQDGSTAKLRVKDVLSGEDVVPGFRCPVRELFPPSPVESQK